MTWFKPQPFQEAVDSIKARGASLPQTFGWQDMWQSAHATGFTVAKSAGFDILKDIHGAVLKAQESGLTLKEFQAQLTPILQAKGWWGRKEVTDPATGEKVMAQLGSPRRLEIIYDTNLRVSYAAGRWAQIERTKARRPYLRYVALLDGRTRPQHRAWHGTILPVDHPWWRTHYPPNGWRCRCTEQQLSQRDLDEFGYQVSDDPPPDEMTPWTNNRTGEVTLVPKGIDPGWAYNPGQAAVEENAARALMGKIVNATPDLAAAQAASA
ncbi:phage head morphogenesis protein, partial [Fundidesulfovibrio butyratiphilus]